MSRHTYNLFVSSTEAEQGGKEHDTANPNYDVIPAVATGTQVKMKYTADTDRVTFTKTVSGTTDAWPLKTNTEGGNHVINGDYLYITGPSNKKWLCQVHSIELDGTLSGVRSTTPQS